MIIGGMPGDVKTAPATKADESVDPDKSVGGLLVSNRCEQLIREFFDDTDEHLGTAGARQRLQS